MSKIKLEERLPEVLDPGNLEEHGISIPAPTPTAISIPNPWKPSTNGGPASGHAGDSQSSGKAGVTDLDE